MNAPFDAADAAPAQALPARYYTNPAIYEAVRDRVLMRAWHYVRHSSSLPEPGDYYAFTLLEQDLFIIRGRDGTLRCFYNVCQHRGHAMVQDTGRTNVLVCPYHAWTYELSGGLRAAPGAKGVAGFDKSKIRLTEVRVEIFLGFVFVNLSEDAPTMREQFTGVEEAVRALCPDIEERVFAHEHEADEFCNWLVAVENYNECYHCGHVHRAFSSGVIDPDSYDIQPFGGLETGVRCLHHRAKPASGDGRWYEAASDYGSFFLFPLFSLQIYPGGLVNTYYWRPEGVADTIVHRGWFSKDGVVDDQLQSVIDLDRDTTFAEDLLLVKNVQRGLGSRGYRPGPLVVAPGGVGIQSEHSIAALHRWVRDAMGGDD